MSYLVEKVNALPAVLKANTFYAIPAAGQANHLDMYLSNQDGTAARRLPTHSDISTMIASALGNFTTVEVVADIAARDALPTIKPLFILVLNASADATVESGSASYVYDASTSSYVKIAEYESLDVVLSWNSIQGRPNSAVADIDDAVARRHSHLNSAVLDKIGETNGAMTYQGMGPFITWGTIEW